MKRPGARISLDGNVGFRQKIVLATLTDKAVDLRGIRASDLEPGIRGDLRFTLTGWCSDDLSLLDYELRFVQLVEKITCGSRFKISDTGTGVWYEPGVITGGKVTHDCGTSRGVGYFLEPLLALAPFTKSGLDVTLKGVTNNNLDVSVDVIRTVLIPLMSKFSDKLRDIELKIAKRGADPGGGGEITLRCPPVEHLEPVDLVDCGKIAKIRGIAYSARVSPQIASRVANTARGALTKYIPNVYVFTDSYRGATSGLSPGYALSLVAQSTTGSLLSAELSSCPGASDPRGSSPAGGGDLAKLRGRLSSPEDLALTTVSMLLAQIEGGGYVDSVSQWLAITFCVFNTQDISSLRIGKITDFT